jgi:hypothetical protein
MTARSITLHAHGYRDGRPVDASTTFAIQADRLDPVAAAGRARGLLLSGAWRTVPKTGSDQDKADYLLRIKVPEALVLLPRPALHALTCNPDQVGCRWDLARFFAALDFQAEPERTDATLALLGEPCSRCSMRHAAADRVAEVRAEVDLEQQLKASGASPLAARVVLLGRRLGLPRDQIARALTAAADPPARPTRDPQGAPAALAARPVYYRHRGRQLSSTWNGPTLRRAVMPSGRPR